MAVGDSRWELHKHADRCLGGVRQRAGFGRVEAEREITESGHDIALRDKRLEAGYFEDTETLLTPAGIWCDLLAVCSQKRNSGEGFENSSQRTAARLHRNIESWDETTTRKRELIC
jgi:hypothetical protein